MTVPRIWSLARLTAGAFILLAASACTDTLGPSGYRGKAHLNFLLDGVVASDVVGLSIEVVGPGIAEPIIVNVTFTSDTAYATLEVPAGSDRIITVRAFDGNGIETHRGVDTLNLRAGENAPVNIVLQALLGDLPITITIGSYVVSITPTVDTLVVGDSLQFGATVLGLDNAPIVNPAVTWGSYNPGVASVSATGKVHALYRGTSRIVVTYRGLAATANLVVVP